jgi:phage gp29-like protein
MHELTAVAPMPTGGGLDAFANTSLLAGEVAPAGYNDRYQQVFGSQGLTPQTVSAVVNLANVGYLWQICDLLDEIREMDGHCASVVQKREQAVAGADWDILAADDPKDPEQLRIAQWTKRELESVRGVQHCFSHLMGAAYYGHAVCEQIWIPINGRMRLVEMIPLHARRFAYAALTDWRLHLWDQVGNDKQPRLGMYPGVPLDAFPTGKFVWHTPRIRGGYPQREGLGRTLLWYSMMKRWAFRDWMALGEWAGRGLRIGTFNTGLDNDPKKKRATEEHKNALKQALLSFSSSSPAVIADTTAIEVLAMAHDIKIHQELIAACDAQMSKVALGNTLTTEVGSTGGNRALGERQGDEQLMLAISDEKQLSETIRRLVIAPMVRYFFGPGVPVPRIRFAVAPEESLLEHAKVIKTLVEAGANIPQAYAYEKFRIPAPKDGEAVMIPKRVNVTESMDAGSIPAPVRRTSSRRTRSRPPTFSKSPHDHTDPHAR